MINGHEVQDTIARVIYHRLEGTNSVICGLVLSNGHVVVGQAHCAPGTEFDPTVGMETARADAERQILPLLAFMARSPQPLNS